VKFRALTFLEQQGLMILHLASCYTPGKCKYYYASFTIVEALESSHCKVTDITESSKGRLEQTFREHLAHSLASKQEQLCLSLNLYSLPLPGTYLVMT